MVSRSAAGSRRPAGRSPRVGAILCCALLAALLLLSPLCCLPTAAYLFGLFHKKADPSPIPVPPAAAGPRSLANRDASTGEGNIALSSTAQQRFSPPTAVVAQHKLNRRQLGALLAHSSSMYECRGTTLDRIRSYCDQLLHEPANQLAKQRITVAVTECHLATISHVKVQSCQDEPDDLLTKCIQDMNQEPSVRTTYTLFTSELQGICQEVDHDFHRKREQQAIDAVLSATISSAEAMKDLQQQTFDMTHELHQTVRSSSATLHGELLQHAAAETARFESLSSATSKLESNQENILQRLSSQTEHLRLLLEDASGIQLLINATSDSIVRTQGDILTLQKDASATAGETKTELIALKETQKAGFERALDSLTQLQTLQDQMAEAQRSGIAAVESLRQSQQAAFEAAAGQLTSLSEDQAAAFRRGEELLTQLHTSQEAIVAEQQSILSGVQSSGEELRRLAAEQTDSFHAAGASLASIRLQAAEAEAKLGAMVGELQHVAQQLLGINLDMLSQLFRIESAFFYVAFAPVVYMLTATDRTLGARFWIFTLLLVTLLVELNLVSAAHRFHYSLSQSQFDAVRSQLRYGLSLVSLLTLALSALLHRDYAQLNYSMAERSQTILKNNHRMLHELLERTEVLSPRAAAAAAVSRARDFKANPFQSRPPPIDDDSSGDEQVEGRPAAAATGGRARVVQSPRKAQRLGEEDWRNIDVQSCCADHQPPQGIRRFFPSTTMGSAAASSTTGTTTGAVEGSTTGGVLPFAAAASPRASGAGTGHARSGSFSQRSTATTDSALPSPRSPLPSRGSPADSDEEDELQDEGRSRGYAAAHGDDAARGGEASDANDPPAAAPVVSVSRRSRRSHSRSRSASTAPDPRVVAARKSATPSRKSAGPRIVHEEQHDDGESGDEEGGGMRQPGAAAAAAIKPKRKKSSA